MLTPQIVNGKPYFVISMSGLQAFKRCRKSFDLGYVRGYEAISVPEPVERGASIHRHLAALATGQEQSVITAIERGDQDAAIAWAYNVFKPVPQGERVIAVEQPFYRILIEPHDPVPGIIMRCTFDMAYRSDSAVVIRDYKSFDRAPTLNVDLDFQGKIYSAFGMRYFKTPHVFFEYEHIRRTLPNVPKDKSGGMWSESECYINTQLIISTREADALWLETQQVAYDLVRAIDEQRFYRTDLRGSSPHTCASCFFRNGCVAEVQQGVLDSQTAALFYAVREPVTIPEGTVVE
jgi:hypothetical protein